MKKITFLYWETCPYCRQARRTMGELIEEAPVYDEIDIEWIETRHNKEAASKYEYDYVPTMFIGEEKMYEAHPGETYEECKESVKAVFEKALR